MKILWLLYIWPEPDSSAAGIRTLELLNALRENGDEVVISSPCQSNAYQENLNSLGFKTYNFKPNDSSFDNFISEYKPEIVFFDRFMIEEQFSWRVKEFSPKSFRILDTIDLHFLRRIRENKFKKNEDTTNLQSDDFLNEDTFREISSIYRSDLSLIISDFELRLLNEQFNISLNILELLRISYKPSTTINNFEKRDNFVFIGNFNHSPNIDCLKLLKESLWTKIKNELNKKNISAELHIYGAYPTNNFLSFDDKKSGFRVFGKTEDSAKTLSNYKINLATLRFGAGIKGKISDGWSVGTPCIGTSIASEGMHEQLEFGGFIEDNWDSFSNRCTLMYTDEAIWNEKSAFGLKIIEKLYNKEVTIGKFLGLINKIKEKNKNSNSYEFFQELLWYQKNRSTKYFSKWIEAKNKN